MLGTSYLFSYCPLKKKCFWCKIACVFWTKCYIPAILRNSMHKAAGQCPDHELSYAIESDCLSKCWVVWMGGWSGVSVCILSCLCPHLLFGHPALPPPYPSLCHPPPPLELIHFASSLSFLLRHPLTFSPLTFSSLLLFSAHCHCHFTCPQTTLWQLCYASVLLPPPPQHTHILHSLLPPPPPKWLNQNITQTRLLGF